MRIVAPSAAFGRGLCDLFALKGKENGGESFGISFVASSSDWTQALAEELLLAVGELVHHVQLGDGDEGEGGGRAGSACSSVCLCSCCSSS